MSHNQSTGQKNSERLKAGAKNHGLDTRKLMERYTVEQIISGFHNTLHVKFLVGGGLIHDQKVRETGDADMRFIRRISESEFMDAFEGMRGMLEGLGIELEPVEKPLILDLPTGSGFKFYIRAWIGGSRVDTHLDIGFGDGRSVNFPPVWDSELPQLIKGAPITKANTQVCETQAAEKLATILVRGNDNTRLKDYADLGMIQTSPATDFDLLAEELGRVLADRRISSSVLVHAPVGLSSAFAMENSAAFSAYQLKSKRAIGDLQDIVRVIQRSYEQARPKALMELQRHNGETFEEAYALKLRPARPSARKDAAKVIDLEQYRHTMPRM